MRERKFIRRILLRAIGTDKNRFIAGGQLPVGGGTKERDAYSFACILPSSRCSSSCQFILAVATGEESDSQRSGAARRK
jgi:hypothetical protein